MGFIDLLRGIGLDFLGTLSKVVHYVEMHVVLGNNDILQSFKLLAILLFFAFSLCCMRMCSVKMF